MKKKGGLIKKLLIGFGILFLIGIIVDSGDSGNNVSTIELKESSASQTREPIDGSTLFRKDGLEYGPGSEVPYSGAAVFIEESLWPKRWVIEGTYKDGKKDGKWTEFYFYKNKRIKCQYSYKDGKKDGLWTGWHENGQKSSKGIFKDGKKDGKWSYWSPDGQESSELIYKNGLPWDGEFIWYHDNGQKKQEGTYKDGSIDGKMTWWGWKNYDKITFKDKYTVSKVETYKDKEMISIECWSWGGNECECSGEYSWGGCKYHDTRTPQ